MGLILVDTREKPKAIEKILDGVKAKLGVGHGAE